MKFKAEHAFRNIDVARYEQLHFDPTFMVALGEAVKVTRTVLRRDLVGAKLHRETRAAADRELPAPVAKIVGANRLEYVEVLDYEMGGYRGDFKILPAFLRDKLEITGTLEFRAGPGATTTRIVTGDIQVRIFAVGGLVEKFVCAELEKSYADAARFTQGWIDAGKAPAGG
jgi:hypothetical protein